MPSEEQRQSARPARRNALPLLGVVAISFLAFAKSSSSGAAAQQAAAGSPVSQANPSPPEVDPKPDGEDTKKKPAPLRERAAIRPHGQVAMTRPCGGSLGQSMIWMTRRVRGSTTTAPTATSGASSLLKSGAATIKPRPGSRMRL